MLQPITYYKVAADNVLQGVLNVLWRQTHLHVMTALVTFNWVRVGVSNAHPDVEMGDVPIIHSTVLTVN